MAAYADKKTLLAQVQKDIDAVKNARSAGVASLQNKFLGGDAAQHSIDSINALPIDDWAKRGIDAVNNGTDPATNGWSGWQAAGATYISGINDITQLGLSATLDNVTATAKAAAAEVKSKVTAVAHSTIHAAETVGTTISGYLHWVAAAVGLALVALLIGRRG